jgi:hypothetical protein
MHKKVVQHKISSDSFTTPSRRMTSRTFVERSSLNPFILIQRFFLLIPIDVPLNELEPVFIVDGMQKLKGLVKVSSTRQSIENHLLT